MRRERAAESENVLQITAFLCNDNLFLLWGKVRFSLVYRKLKYIFTKPP